MERIHQNNFRYFSSSKKSNWGAGVNYLIVKLYILIWTKEVYHHKKIRHW